MFCCEDKHYGTDTRYSSKKVRGIVPYSIRIQSCCNVMDVCIVITYSKIKDQPGKVANPARGQLNRENDISLSPFVPENLVSRDAFASSIP